MVGLVTIWSIDVGSLHDWLVVLKAFSLFALVSAILGGVIGFLSKGRIVIELVASFVTTAAFMVFLQWKAGTLGTEWSLQHPIASISELIGPFLYLLFAPAAAAAFFVGRWRRQRAARIGKTI